MLNRITITGRLTRDPELRTTQSGISVTSFSIANQRNYKNNSGERETDFFDVVAWRNTAEFVTKYFVKGSLVTVDGRLETRKFTDKQGNERKTVEIIADNVFFGDSKNEQRETAPAPAAAAAAAATGFEPDFSAPAPSGSSDFDEILDDSDLDGFPPLPF